LKADDKFMKKFRGKNFVKGNRMSFLFYPGKPLKAVGMILAWMVVLTGVDVKSEEIARVSAPKPPKSSPIVSRVYELQLNSFKVEANAKKFFAGLVKKGYKPFMVFAKNGDTWFKVRLGPYPSKNAAHQIKTELQDKHGLSSFALISGKTQSKPEVAPKLTATKVTPENTGNSIDVVMSQFLVWLEAWQGKQLDSYFSFYSQSFESGGKPFKDWLKEQSKTLDEIQQIKVEVNDLELLEKGDTIEMSFIESFQSKSFSDIRRKVLVWKKEKGVWKIIVESSEPA
jgi:ketosteroid isomerase-like protein